jgi:hypothetical protein
LQVSAIGGLGGPGSRLVAFAGPGWSGDYLSSGVTQIEMDLRNFGSTELTLRLLLAGPANSSAISTTPVVLAAGSAWQRVSFGVTVDALTGSPALALAEVNQLRLFHSTTPVSPGETIAARLGVDNVTAVPEPTTALLLGAGLLFLWTRRRRPGVAVDRCR